VLTSNRVSRWILELQEYELEICHIKGSQNHFADILSRNPAGLTKEQIKEITRPKELMVAPINLNLDQSIKRELKNIEEYQTRDPAIQSIKKRLETADSTVSRRYTTHNRIAYCKPYDQNPLWRVYLPETLETKVINFGHRTLGHAGSDKTKSHSEFL
jgi:hypothetical protein